MSPCTMPSTAARISSTSPRLPPSTRWARLGRRFAASASVAGAAHQGGHERTLTEGGGHRRRLGRVAPRRPARRPGPRPPRQARAAGADGEDTASRSTSSPTRTGRPVTSSGTSTARVPGGRRPGQRAGAGSADPGGGHDLAGTDGVDRDGTAGRRAGRARRRARPRPGGGAARSGRRGGRPARSDRSATSTSRAVPQRASASPARCSRPSATSPVAAARARVAAHHGSARRGRRRRIGRAARAGRGRNGTTRAPPRQQEPAGEARTVRLQDRFDAVRGRRAAARARGPPAPRRWPGTAPRAAGRRSPPSPRTPRRGSPAPPTGRPPRRCRSR